MGVGQTGCSVDVYVFVVFDDELVGFALWFEFEVGTIRRADTWCSLTRTLTATSYTQTLAVCIAFVGVISSVKTTMGIKLECTGWVVGRTCDEVPVFAVHVAVKSVGEVVPVHV